MAKFYCVESTLDFDFKGHYDLEIRIWSGLDADESMLFNLGQSLLYRQSVKDCAAGSITCKTLCEELANTLEHLNAVQVRRGHPHDPNKAKFGHMIYTVPFEDKQ